VNGLDKQQASLLGPAYSNEQILLFLDSVNAKYDTYTDEKQLLDKVTDLINDGKVIGWFQDRMEFGPRALGKPQYYR